MKIKKTKHELQGGVCASRWSCENVNKDCCHPIPLNGELFIECDFYKTKKYENKNKRLRN